MMITEDQEAGADCTKTLNDLCNYLYERSMDATLTEKLDGETDDQFDQRLFALQDEMKTRAEELKDHLDALFVQDFTDRTAIFDKSYTELKITNANIQNEINALNALVVKMRQFNQFLQLVDQAIVIAAGLAKSV